MKRALVATAIFVGLWDASVAVADAPIDVYKRRIDERIEHAKKLFRPRRAVWTRSLTSTPDGGRPKGLDQDNAAAVSRLAALAIKTEVEGAEAGLVFAPRVLVGDTSVSARAWDVTIAALKEGRFRLGTSVRRSFGKRLVSPEDIGLKLCPLDEDKYRAALRNAADEFDAVCQVMLTAPRPSDAPADAKALTLWVQSQVACTDQAPAGLSPKLAGIAAAVANSNLIARLTIVLAEFEALNNDAATTSALRSELGRVQLATVVLDAVIDGMPSDTSCRKDDEIAVAAIQAKWQRPVRTLGVSLHGDLLPYKFGFNPSASTDKPEKLSKGELVESELRFEVRQSCGRLTWTAGLGGTASRDKAGEDFRFAVKPSAGIEYVAFRLDGGDVEDKDGAVNLTDDDELPAYLVLGFDASVGVTLNPPDEQEDRIESVEITAFADFKITDELGFRIGIPLEAELVERAEIEATMTPAKKARQWTVPVFLATVIKI